MPWERPARIGRALAAFGVPVERLTLLGRDSRPVPDVETLAGIVVMGGPMRATDTTTHSALSMEVDLLRRAVESDVPVLGVCLGHQLLAIAHGAELVQGEPEIGVAPITVVASSGLGEPGDLVEVVHWHRDQVTLPPGAELLASSDACVNQAFRIGPALGLQFHLEVDHDMLREWLSRPEMSDDLPPVARLEEDFTRIDSTLARLSEAVFGDFAARAARRGAS